MSDKRKKNRYSKTLKQLLGLKASPVAVKMLLKRHGIPKGALRPYKDQGRHYAQCILDNFP
jgi:uncharacterized protein (DUF169 family)